MHTHTGLTQRKWLKFSDRIFSHKSLGKFFTLSQTFFYSRILNLSSSSFRFTRAPHPLFSIPAVEYFNGSSGAEYPFFFLKTKPNVSSCSNLLAFAVVELKCMVKYEQSHLLTIHVSFVFKFPFEEKCKVVCL